MRQNEIYSGSFGSTVTSIFKSNFVAFWTSCGRIFLTRYNVVGLTCCLELNARLDYQLLFGKAARTEGRPDTKERRKSSLVEIMYSVVIFSDSSPPLTFPHLPSPYLPSPHLPLPPLISSYFPSPQLPLPPLISPYLPSRQLPSPLLPLPFLTSRPLL